MYRPITFSVIYQYFISDMPSTQVGNWTRARGLSIDRGKIRLMGGTEIVSDFVSRLANRTISTVTIEEPPFIIIKNKNMNKDRVIPGVDIEGNPPNIQDYMHHTRGRYRRYSTQYTGLYASYPG